MLDYCYIVDIDLIDLIKRDWFEISNLFFGSLLLLSVFIPWPMLYLSNYVDIANMVYNEFLIFGAIAMTLLFIFIILTRYGTLEYVLPISWSEKFIGIFSYYFVSFIIVFLLTTPMDPILNILSGLYGIEYTFIMHLARSGTFFIITSLISMYIKKTRRLM